MGSVSGAVQREQALVDVRDVLERRRQLEIQARFGDHFLDLAQGIDHTKLALVDHKQHGAGSASATSNETR
jgi:hypothetical protein